ncbi:SDR family oxidoreductase [Streptomyces sp. NPDC049099]|uniref:SDR family oxidoreductase n=1 Tax=Streptomyces sp. NPDC049099 TaxID=3155768 RepID=UPI003448B216
MFLVTGATGNVGRQVVELLLDAGARVRALSRRPETAGLPDGVEVVAGDLQRPESAGSALEGVQGLFLFPAPGGLDGFLRAAKEAGTERVVLLSASAVGSEEAGPLGRAHAECEQAVRASGLPWTVLRPGAFMVNDLRWAPAVRGDGVVRAPFARAVTSPIDERDIAAVATRALLDDAHTGATLELSGPQALTPVERVRILGEVLGRELRFEEQSPEQARAEWTKHAPAEIVDGSLSLYASLVDAESPVLDTVERVTGRPPTRYAQWAARHAADFV